MDGCERLWFGNSIVFRVANRMALTCWPIGVRRAFVSWRSPVNHYEPLGIGVNNGRKLGSVVNKRQLFGYWPQG